MTGLGPDVEIVNHGRVIDCDVEDAETFTVSAFTTACSVPRFDEIEFHSIASIRQRQIVR